jgi:hypothetical protein
LVFAHVWAIAPRISWERSEILKGFGMEVVVTIESSMRRPSAPVIVFLLTLASTVGTVQVGKKPSQDHRGVIRLFDEGFLSVRPSVQRTSVANRFLG